jgi:glucose-1-phosphate cytidylyltransferase
MKVVILAGGYGTRISEETDNKPKPMVLLGNKPILWHLMQTYAQQGFTEFVIACGYKKESIQEWVSSEDFGKLSIEAIDTGLNTQTGGRIKRALDYLGEKEILLSYGDGLANVNIHATIDIYKKNKARVLVTAVRPPARFGLLEADGSLVTHFGEKSHADSGWINGGFFVISQEVGSYIENDDESFEFVTLPKLVKEKSLYTYFHEGFWQPMDTLREKRELEGFVNSGYLPWLDTPYFKS